MISKNNNYSSNIVKHDTNENNLEDFDWEKYVSSYDDLKNITTEFDAKNHWINYGKKENRIYFKSNAIISNLTENLKNKVLQKKFTIHTFDWEKYIKFYDDLNSCGLNNKQTAWNHWITKGIKENRVDFLYNEKPVLKLDNSEQESKQESKQEAKQESKQESKKEDKQESKKEDNYTNDINFIIFDWKSYIHYYEDLSTIQNKKDAWNHWINNGKNEGRIFCDINVINANSEDYKNFNWQDYISNYDDLTTFNTKKKAWIHWNYFGKNEQRVLYNLKQKVIEEYKIIKNQTQTDTNPLLNNSIDLKFKKIYNNYGTHYYGWKMVINQFVNLCIDYYNNNEKEKLIFNKQIFFDEWIEKLLIWGNKIEKQKILDKITTKNYDIITFIHSPPYLKWYNFDTNIEEIKNELIISDDFMLNNNLFNELSINNLDNKITYLYTFSIHHKKYLYDNYPDYRNKIVSIYHPIDTLNANENNSCFNFDLFMSSKKIIHIGWWLRNFKTFINFKQPENYSKIILVKNDFKEQWNIFSKNYDINDIIIFENLDNNDYESLFKDSCVFIDLEDSVANNTILECIKFNTPIIIRRHPSVEEYLGKNYPLFFETTDELLLFNNETYLEEMIFKAANYLTNMNKTHVSLNTFNNKLLYDIYKLKNTNKNMLTWCCFIDKNINNELFDNFINNFISQNGLDLCYLKIFINENLYNDEEVFNIEFKIHISAILDLYKNINVVIIKDVINNMEDNIFDSKNVIDSLNNDEINNDDNDNQIVEEKNAVSTTQVNDNINLINLCLSNIDTEYFNIVNITDLFHIDYSKMCVDFLNANFNYDIITTSYTLINKIKNKTNNIVIKTEKMIFLNKIKKYKFTLSGIVWRAKIFELINFNELNIYNDFNNIKNILYKCFENNLNIVNISDNSEMLIKSN